MQRSLGRPSLRHRLAALAIGAVIGAGAAALAASDVSASGQVLVAKGAAVHVAAVLPMTGGNADLGSGALNAVRLAIALHPRIKGFPIQLQVLDGPCGPDGGQNVAAANQIVADPRNVAVIGHFCSNHMIEVLPIYESAGVVTVSGSTTNPALPSYGPNVFNSVAVPDGCCPYVDNFDPWYATVAVLPVDQIWRQIYLFVYRSPAPDFADLYFDATRLLIAKVSAAATLDENGNLIVDRTSLAQKMRSTSNFPAVTCAVSLGPDGFRINDSESLARCASTGG